MTANEKKPLRVLVCGDRTWKAYLPIRLELSKLPPRSVIIHGACDGADKYAGMAAKHLGLTVEEFPADWSRWGKAAGPIRNQEMLDVGKPDLVIAFHAHIEDSKGTKDMCRRAMEAGIETRIVKA